MKSETAQRISYEEEQRAIAARWADAEATAKRLSDAADSAKTAAASARSKADNLRNDLTQYVGRNVTRKLYQTELGYVLVQYRFVGGDKYQAEVELLPLS